MFIPTKIIAHLKHKYKILIKQINYKGLIMQVSFWNNQFFIKMTQKFNFKNVEKFTFYSCFWISLQIHNWDKCCHLVFGKAFVYKRQNTIVLKLILSKLNLNYSIKSWRQNGSAAAFSRNAVGVKKTGILTSASMLSLSLTFLPMLMMDADADESPSHIPILSPLGRTETTAPLTWKFLS